MSDFLNSTDTLGYLRRLFEPGDWINLQFIHQTEKRADGGAKIDNNFLTLEDALKPATLDAIKKAQDEGWNSYVAMNAFTPGLTRRRKKDVKTVRNVYIEFDEKGEAGLDAIDKDSTNGLVPAPDFILQSSSGKFYVIWRVAGVTVEQQEALNSALQQRYGSDPASVDAARVLRLPGTRNLKYATTPVVEIIEEGLADRHSFDEFKIEYHVKARVDHTADPEKVAVRVGCYEQACEDAGVDIGYCKQWEGGYLYEVDCPNYEQHTGMVKSGGSVKIHASGRISYGCFHAHCQNLDWKTFYRPWMEEQAKENGFEGFLKFGELSEVSEEDRKDETVLIDGKRVGSAQHDGTAAPEPSDQPPPVPEQVRSLIFSSSKDRVKAGLPSNALEALNKADTLIYADLLTKGKFFNVGGLGYLLDNKKKDSPVKISPGSAECLDLLQRYNLHAGRDATNAVGKFLGVRSYMDGQRTDLHISFHYDPARNTAYYAEASGRLLKVTKDGVSNIDNGDDGILFTFPETYKPWTLQPAPRIAKSLIPQSGSALYDAVFKGLTFEESSMTFEQKCILLTVYLILLFLPGINKSKIILQLTGPSGSGKSFFLEVLGRLVMGPKFSVQPMPSDPKEFENQVINNSYIAYDNVNYISPDIKDLLCQAATGLTVRRRELFTTMGQVEHPAVATIGISGITSVLTEVEQNNRSLVLKMEKRRSFQSAVDLMAELDSRRDELMTEIIERVRMVLTAIDAQRDYKPAVNVRLADIATFLLRVSKHEGWENQARELLTAWDDEQSSAAMEDDDVGQLFTYVLRNPDFKPAWLPSSEFKDLLVRTGRMKQVSMGLWVNKAPKTLATTLVRNEGAYAMRYGLEIQTDKHTKNRVFRLNPSPELLARVRESATTVEDLIEQPEPDVIFGSAA